MSKTFYYIVKGKDSGIIYYIARFSWKGVIEHVIEEIKHLEQLKREGLIEYEVYINAKRVVIEKRFTQKETENRLIIIEEVEKI